VARARRFIVSSRVRRRGSVDLVAIPFVKGAYHRLHFYHPKLTEDCRSFDCGKHQCEKSCHPPSSKSAICPRSPSKIDRCPCGRNTIAPTPSSDASQYRFPARLDCSDPIPTCDSVCSKPHLACSHQCTAKCHTGSCPPCTVQIVRPCRCGATTKSMACFQVHSASVSGVEEKEILCDKPCMALRACGRHECRRLCCPLASLAMSANKKGKRRGIVDDNQGIGEEQGGLHECDLVCSKMLSCGNHRCEQRDHKGACSRCLRSSFEEVSFSDLLLYIFIVPNKSTACLFLWAHCLRTSNSMRNEYRVPLSMSSAPATMQSPQYSSFLPF